MTLLRIEYLDASGAVVGIYTQAVSLSGGQSLTIDDPNFVDPAGVPALLAFSPQPANGAAGATLSGVQVAIQDINGNTVDTATNAVTVALGANPGNGTLGGTLTQNAVNGIAFFPDLTISAAGTGYTLVGTSAGLSAATSNPFDVSGQAGAGATQVAFAAPLANGTTNTTLPPIQVEVLNANNQVLATASNPVTLTLGVNPGGATLSGTTTVNAVNGVATFNDLQIDKPGTGYTLVASSVGLAQGTSSAFRLGTTLAFTSTKYTTNAGNGPGTDPNAIAIGDFNGDGNPDFATANNVMNNPRLSVFLGNGNGTFQNEALYNTTAGAQFATGVAAGDFNNDGKADLAVINATNVDILLSVNGTFPAATNIAIGTALRGICTGEFSGDNFIDIALSDAGTESVRIMVNNGNNTFTNTNYPSGAALQTARGIVAADFSGDGRTDLAVANFGTNAGTTVWINSKNAGALFPAANTVVLPASSATATAQMTSAGDYNNDGRIDVGTAYVDGNNAKSRIYLNQGGNVFTVASTSFISQDPFGAGSADFNQDGQVDFLAGSAFGLNFVNPGEISVSLGNGDGTVNAQQRFSVNPGGTVRGVSIGDFNKDGKPDVVTSAGDAHVLMNNSI